ncbi:platelet endothelial cell adhesion molecule-like [Anabas testudineus]|uniref:platelet endothelial cell adhesion molecule-like n=1 Tax=Anabas testudineus TaxID=64144 RepID=UPI00143D83BA|nr:platelet endothelial cell adhesion molecule-like [Anabas testudineus]
MFVYVCVFFSHSASTLPLKLHETAQSSRISTMFVSLAVVIVGLCYCSTGGGQSFLETPQLFGPSEALVGEIVKFRCELANHPKNEPVLMHLLQNRTKWMGDSSSLNGEAGTFTLVIKRQHEGNLVCKATLQNNTDSVEATFSNTHYLKVVEPVKGAAIVVHSGPVQFFEGATLNLSCQTTAGNYLTYKWLLNDRPIPRSPFHVMSDKHLLIYRTTSKDSGSYKCEASNEFNNTVHTNTSKEVVITVKDVVSNPDVSFVVLKWNSHNYSAEVTCNLTRGTLPITFSLYNREQLIGNVTSKERKATFKVPVVLGQHMGWLQCQADNGDRTAHSQWMALKLVGQVMMTYECDMGENYAVVHVRFFCKVAKGSHPSYKWFLNNTLLSEQQSFYRVDNQPPGESMLLLSVGRESAGTYHCEASDSFDNTTSISSMKLYMDKEVLNHLPVLVVAVVFGCFTVLIVLVSVCCCVGVVFRRRRFGENSLLGLEMKKNIIAYEGELDPLDCSEDEDLGNTTSWAEYDQASEASADEWPQIIEEKKTLEDGPVEFP